MKKINGLMYGILSSASFGLIPLFAIPAMQHGMSFMNVLTYRFLFATLALSILLRIKNISFTLTKTDIPSLLLLSFFYLISSVFLLWGYQFMPSGIATTIHFMYPVITTLIMMFIFHEKNSLWRTFSITLAVIGVYTLSGTQSEKETHWGGILIVLLSAIGYALYLVTVGQRKNKQLQGLRLTFHVFFWGTLLLLTGMAVTHQLQGISDITTAANLLMLAIIPTVISNLALIESIKHIGATQASVLGAMEPVTAVVVGIIAFGETFTLPVATGILLILSAVVILILKK